MVSYFPLISGIISVVFLILLTTQYFRKRKTHQLMWTIALALFTLSYTLAFLSELNGWNVLTFQIYYFSISPLVAFMGVGTLFLISHKPWGKYFLIYTIILTIVLFILIFTANIDATKFAQAPTPSEIAGEPLPSYARSIPPLLTIPGSVILIVGALYSWWLDRSRRYVMLIALGGIVELFSGLRTRLGNPTYSFVFNTAGILLLFLGFVLSSEYVKKCGEKPATSSKISN